MELAVHIAAYYGLRRSEIIGLKWDSIDFTQKTITIRRRVITVSDDDGKYKPICEDKLKTNATRRTLPLIPHIEKMLKEKKEQQTHFKKLLKGGYNKEYDGFVCTDDMGNLITPNYVTSHFKYVIDKNGLKFIRFHDLQHTCASLLIANHILLKAVQDWLGHANFQTTANIYSHLDFSSRVESAEAISHKDCALDTQSDCIKILQVYCHISKKLCVILRKISKYMMYKAFRRLCAVLP